MSLEAYSRPGLTPPLTIARQWQPETTPTRQPQTGRFLSCEVKSGQIHYSARVNDRERSRQLRLHPAMFRQTFVSFGTAERPQTWRTIAHVPQAAQLMIFSFAENRHVRMRKLFESRVLIPAGSKPKCKGCLGTGGGCMWRHHGSTTRSPCWQAHSPTGSATTVTLARTAKWHRLALSRGRGQQLSVSPCTEVRVGQCRPSSASATASRDA